MTTETIVLETDTDRKPIDLGWAAPAQTWRLKYEAAEIERVRATAHAERNDRRIQALVTMIFRWQESTKATRPELIASDLTAALYEAIKYVSRLEEERETLAASVGEHAQARRVAKQTQLRLEMLIGKLHEQTRQADTIAQARHAEASRSAERVAELEAVIAALGDADAIQGLPEAVRGVVEAAYLGLNYAQKGAAE